jgi:hypothetical protein
MWCGRGSGGDCISVAACVVAMEVHGRSEEEAGAEEDGGGDGRHDRELSVSFNLSAPTVAAYCSHSQEPGVSIYGLARP